MGILSKLMGTAQGTAARSGRSARTTGRPAMKRKTMGTGGGTARMARRTPTRGRAGAPAAGGGLGKLLGGLTKRR